MCLPVKPYKVEREWKHAGLSCAVVLAREAAHRCGYVRVPPGHPMHGKDYDTPDVEVHGGLTFGEIETCKEHEDGQGWWFGFDCCHLFDARFDPSMTAEDCATEEGRVALQLEKRFQQAYSRSSHGLRERPEHYWTEAEVAAECERLADQLAKVTA